MYVASELPGFRRRARSAAAKRALDLLISLPLLVVLSPLFFVAAIAIKASSPGPVLYRAKRAGLHGRTFQMHKFRSMHCDADKTGPAITARNDVRIFWVGDVLRKTKIDELPQLFDVARGRMSLVGPRPEDPDIVAQFYTPRHWQTLQVKPGMTSPAAIHYSTVSDDHLNGDDVLASYVENILDPKLDMELAYIERATLLTDIQVLFQSFLFVGRKLLNKAI